MKVDENIFKREQVEINLVELCKYICGRIIWVLLFSVILAVLIPSLKYASDKNAVGSNGGVDNELQREQLQSYYDRIELYKQTFETEMKYKEESVYINLDYKNINVITLQYDIKAAEENLVDVMTAFSNYGNDGAMVRDMYELDNSVETIYLKEILKVTCSTYATYDVSSIMAVRIYANSEEDCKKYAYLVQQVLEKYSNSLNEAGISNELVKIYEKNYIGQDAAVLNAQKTLNATLTDAENNITALETEINNMESQGIFLGDSIQGNDVTQDVTFSRKYVVVGFAVGFILAVIVLVIKYIVSGKVKFNTELHDMTGIRYIGNLSAENRGLGEKISNKLFLCDKYKNVKEERLYYKLQAMCDVSDIKEISIIGNDKVCKENKINAIGEKLKNASFSIVGDVVDDVNAMNKFGSNENAIIVIRANQTSYAYLEEMMKLCSIKETNVMGYIFIN